MFNRKYNLPRSFTELDALVDRIVKKYKLDDKVHAQAMICNAISHLPNDGVAKCSDEYLGNFILKHIANTIVDHRRNELRHEAQVNYLYDTLKQDPANNQARDELQKAADQGSDSAKKAIEKLFPKDATNGDNISNVIPIQSEQ